MRWTWLPSAFVKERTNELTKGPFLLGPPLAGGSLECAKSTSKVQVYFLGSALAWPIVPNQASTDSQNNDRLTNGKPALAHCIGDVETEFGQM
jgi:hypothetical protein